jgi:hypothetical protein
MAIPSPTVAKERVIVAIGKHERSVVTNEVEARLTVW